MLLVDRPDSVQSTVYIGFSTVPMRDPEFLPLSVANEVLGGSASSRLFLDLREQHGWTYGAYSSLDETASFAPAYLYADVDAPASGAALAEFFAVLGGLVELPAPAEELAAREAYLTRVLPLRVETPLSLAAMLTEQRVNGLPDDWWNSYRDRVLGFSGRILPASRNPDLAKYINSPETEIYHKSQMLYGLNHDRIKMVKDWRKAATCPLPALVDTGTVVITPENVEFFYH